MNVGGTAELEQNMKSHCSRLPVREIGNEADLARFQQSETFQNFFEFIKAMGDAVCGQSARPFYSNPETSSAHVQWAWELVRDMEEMVAHHPPLPNANSRFGNPAFRTWLEAIRELTYERHRQQPDLPEELWEEIATYLVNSVGDWQRLDYGTGHEAHFAAWLYCLCHSHDKNDNYKERIQIIDAQPADEQISPNSFCGPDDFAYLVLLVFRQYMSLMRVLQSTYWLEPAGSHGVWGLDDHHFLPFIWGAAQLINHPQNLHPKCIHDVDLVEALAPDYLYLDCIHAINRVKTKVALAWHSPLLNDISAVRSWSKVYEGLLKMYRVEVLGKLPIMQHFLFGKILSFKGDSSEKVDTTHRHGHHMTMGRGDCCGNPLPSIYAAAAATTMVSEECKTQATKGRGSCQHRPPDGGVPFD